MDCPLSPTHPGPFHGFARHGPPQPVPGGPPTRDLGRTTMGFSVDVAALTGLPRQMTRLGEDAAAARTYVDRYTQLGSDEGIINIVLGGHREATRKVSTFYRMLN